MELTSLHKESYGGLGLTRQGAPADPSKCAHEVDGDIMKGDRSHQCNRKRGYGPEGAFCKQHDPAATEARQEKSMAAFRAQMDHRRTERWGPQFLGVLREIADGHNDPRTLAKEILARYDGS